MTRDAVMMGLPSTGAARALRRRRLRHALAVHAASGGITPPERSAARPWTTTGRASDGRALTDTQPVVSTTAVSEFYASLMSSRRSAREA